MIILLPLKISNAFLVKEPVGCVLVDSGSPGEERRLTALLQKYGQAPAQVSLLIHTHAHTDHAGSSAALVQQYGWSTAVQELDAQRLGTGENGPVNPRSLMGWLIKKAVFASYPSLTASMVFKDELPLEPFGINGKLMHTPGHTPGSCSLVLNSGQAVVGDLFMGGILGGYIAPGVCGYHYYIDNRNQLHQSIARLLNMGVETFYCGHGGPVSRKAVIKKFGWLVT